MRRILGRIGRAMPSPRARLRLHIETGEPIEVGELTASLAALAHQYQSFLTISGLKSEGEAKLLVDSVSRGSIDVSLIPDLATIAGIAVPAIEQAAHVVEFGKKLKEILEYFKPSTKSETAVKVSEGDHPKKPTPRNITARDCDDAINILGPVANHGGTQNITIINAPGGIVLPVSDTNAPEARRAIENAARLKARLTYPQAETRQAVALSWQRLGTEKAKTEGRYSPDKAIIEELDARARPVFFTDEMSYLKREMILDEDNPYQMIYFVDVEVSRIKGKITSYRVIGYLGKEPFADLFGIDVDVSDL